MTEDHIAFLLWIQQSEDPTWNFLSQNYPPLRLWNIHIVAQMIRKLRDAKMIDQPDVFKKIEILQPGIIAINTYMEHQKMEEQKSDLGFEK